MLLDPATYELAERSAELLDRLGGPGRFKLELPAAQLELVTRRTRTCRPRSASWPRRARTLLDGADALVRPAAAGVAPVQPGGGPAERGRALRAHRGGVRAHGSAPAGVRAPGARGGGRGRAHARGLQRAARASARARRAGGQRALPRGRRHRARRRSARRSRRALPRQGIPPRARELGRARGRAALGPRLPAALPELALWWWELRPHLSHGTLELRVPDAQTTIAEAAAVAAVSHALVVWLAERHDAGELA